MRLKSPTFWKLSIYVFFVIISSMFLNHILLRTSENQTEVENSYILKSPESSEYHSPISIIGNAQLTAFTPKTGSGNSTDPYLIKDLIIDGGGLFSTFIIQNTNMHLVIQNCTIYGSTDYGIKIINGNNINITQNLIKNNPKGIRIESSSGKNINIESNNISQNSNTAIDVYQSDNIKLNISRNIISQSSYGIRLDYCDGSSVLIEKNNITTNYGIYSTYANYNKIQNNNFSESTRGIYLKSTSTFNEMDGNLFTSNSYGIYLETSDSNKIYRNIFVNNDIGIYFYYASSNDVQNNSISSGSTGLKINHDSDSNTIHYNNITDNSDYGISVSNANYAAGNSIKYNIIVHNSLDSIYADHANFYSSNTIDYNNLNLPVIQRSFPNPNYPLFSTNHIITWTMFETDFVQTTYSILLNNTPIIGHNDQTWGSGQPISLNIDGLSLGDYNYTMVSSDGWGGINEDTIIVSVFNPVPNIAPQNDIFYEKGTTGHIINWTVTDSITNDTEYTVFFDEVPMIGYINQSWYSGESIIINVDGLDEGLYNFTLIVKDGYGGYDSEEVLISIFLLPSYHSSIFINGNSELISFQPKSGSGTENDPYIIKSLIINGGGLYSTFVIQNTAYHLVIQNCTIYDSLDYGIKIINSNNINITQNLIKNNPMGIRIESSSGKNINIEMNNFSQNGNTAINIYQSDNIKLNISRNNISQSSYGIRLDYCDGSSVLIEKNNITASSGIYSTYANYNKIQNNIFSESSRGINLGSTSGFNEIVGNLFISEHYGIYLSQSDSNKIYRNIFFDNDIGIYFHQASSNDVQNNSISSGSTGLEIFRESDSNTIHYNNITKNSKNGINVRDADDADGNSIRHNVIVHNALDPIYADNDNFYVDNSIDDNNVNIPTISHPSDMTFPVTTLGKFISWTVVDVDFLNIYYTIYKNGTPINGYINRLWNPFDPITYDLDGLMYGTYNITIIANDGWGAEVEDNVSIIVTNILPSIELLGDISYEYNSINHSLTWTITDTSTLNPKYTIYLNDVPLLGHNNQSWSSGLEITINIDGLPEDTYNYTIIASDGLGATSRVETLVIVINSIPNISPVNDIEYEFSSTGHYINWTISDPSILDPRYTIYQNGTPISSHQNNEWISEQGISIILDGLTEGTYNYTIIASDGYGAISRDEVWITVVDNTAPYINSPDDIQYTQNTPEHSIIWIISDLEVFYPSYSIYRDGMFLISESWSSNNPIEFSVDGLTTGSYNYTIIAFDGWGEKCQDGVIVNVISNTGPLISSSIDSSYSYTEGLTNNLIEWQISDSDSLSPFYSIFRNGILIISEHWPMDGKIIFSLDGLDPGNYRFRIEIEDGLGGFVEDEIIVSVIEAEPPDNLLLSLSSNIYFLVIFSAGGIFSMVIFKRKTEGKNSGIRLDKLLSMRRRGKSK